MINSQRLDRASDHLGRALSFRTVSHADTSLMDLEEHVKFQDWVLKTYPLTSSTFTVRRIGPWNLSFHFGEGEPQQPPLVLLAHYDVVPPGDEGTWIHPPFSGDRSEGAVWGRGALDVKINLVAILEAVEEALATGWRPQRELWLCFGGDEEIGGVRGAGELGQYLASQGVRDAWLVDEGGVIAQGVLSWIERPVALIGVAEKGFVNLRIRAEGVPGHASMPPSHTAAGLLAQALVRIEKSPFPARLTKTLEAFLKAASVHAPGALKPLLAAPRLFWPVLKRVLGASPKTGALIRTTQALTMLRASDKENVLPAEASAIVNVRILPGDTVDSVLDHYQKLLKGTGCMVEVADAHHRNEPLPESAVQGTAWQAVTSAMAEAEPSAVILPYLVTAGTDTRHYIAVAPHQYRAMALLLGPEEIDLIHSPNERISLENLGRTLTFYDRLIRS